MTTQATQARRPEPRRSTPRASRSAAGSRLVPYAFASPATLIVLVLMIIPVGVVIYYSLLDNVVVEKNPTFVGLDHYRRLLGDATFRRTLLHTGGFITGSALGHLVLGFAFALLVNTTLLRRHTRTLLRALLILLWIFTDAVKAIVWRLILDPYGVMNYMLQTVAIVDTTIPWLATAPAALAIVTGVNIWSGYPFILISLLAGLQGVSKDLHEAARVDGAGVLRRLWSVTLPHLRPLIISLLLLDLLWSAQQFTLIWGTTAGGPAGASDVMSTYTYRQAFSSFDISGAAASAVMVLALTLIVGVFYVRQQRRLASGG